MFNSNIETPDLDESGIAPSSFRFRHVKTKKYMFHKMITKQQREVLMKLKRKTKKKDPQYFSKMLRQQRKKMLVSTFVKKLKNSITLNQPPFQCKSSTQYESQDQLQSIQIPKNIEIGISLFIFFQIIPLLVLNSLSLIFDQVLSSSLLTGYNVFSFIIHILQMLMKLFIKHNYQQKKKKFLIQNINSYIYSQDIFIDILILLGFLGQFIFKSTQNYAWIYTFHILIIFKIKTLLVMLGHIQLTLIQNQYRQEIWNLIKVFLFNFVIAHCLTIILISMTNFNQDKNWMVNKGISQSTWKQQYVWAYYWATTIMLTVGFGDIVPTNKDQALCMIFVQTVSCIVLAYNINRVGSIISKIRSYDLQKNSNLKVFNQISQKTQIDPQIQTKLTNYIKQSTIIKRNSNIQEQNNFISKLPLSFKQQLLKQMNKNVWNGMIFFRNLSQKSLLQLSKYLQKKLTHPQQIVYTRGQQVNLMIFNNGTFGLAYNNGSAKSNGQIIQKYTVQANQYRIASLQFLLDRPMNYDIKCVDYTIFYKVTLKSFLSILQNHPYDYQYYFMIKQKDKFLLNQFQIQKCNICKNQRHTMFKCPRLHYIPLKQHLIGRYNKGLKKRHLQNLRSKILKRQKISDVDSLKQRKNYKTEMIKIRLQICANRSDSSISNCEDSIQPYNGSNQKLKSQTIMSQSYQQLMDQCAEGIEGMFSLKNQRTYLDMAMDHIKQNIAKQNLANKHKQYSNQLTPHGVWEVQCDLAHNYKFYFKNYNSQDLDKKILKRKPKASIS